MKSLHDLGECEQYKEIQGDGGPRGTMNACIQGRSGNQEQASCQVWCTCILYVLREGSQALIDNWLSQGLFDLFGYVAIKHKNIYIISR